MGSSYNSLAAHRQVGSLGLTCALPGLPIPFALTCVLPFLPTPPSPPASRDTRHRHASASAPALAQHSWPCCTWGAPEQGRAALAPAFLLRSWPCVYLPCSCDLGLVFVFARQRQTLSLAHDGSALLLALARVSRVSTVAAFLFPCPAQSDGSPTAGLMCVTMERLMRVTMGSAAQTSHHMLQDAHQILVVLYKQGRGVMAS